MRIGSQCGKRMSRYVDFGNNGDKTFLGIADHFSYFVLRVVSAMRHTVKAAVAHPFNCLPAMGACPGKCGIFLYFDTPSLVVGEMPMKVVDVVKSQQVDIFLHEVSAVKVAAYIEHHTSIMKTGRVCYIHLGETDLSVGNVRRNRFAKCPDAVEDTCFISTFNCDVFCCDSERVAFGSILLLDICETDIIVGRSFDGGLQI